MSIIVATLALLARLIISHGKLELNGQDFRIENNEADGPSQHHQQRRKVVNTKKKRDGPRHGPNKDCRCSSVLWAIDHCVWSDTSDYFGDDAEYLRLQALQVLLRTQVRAVKKLWDLPDVFEVR